MAFSPGELSDWNPMSEDFITDYINGEGQNTIEEAPVPVGNQSVKDALAAEAKARNAKQQKYPYLVVKKTSKLVTENMLINFFGRDLIQDQEYRPMSRVYFVYFKNLGSLEAAQSKVECYPSLLECHRGRQKPPQQEFPPVLNDNISTAAADPVPIPSIRERTDVNLSSRDIYTSAGCQKHPVFIQPPLLTKADYAAKGSLLAINDPDRRYLNVKDEFALERHGAYVVREEREDSVLISLSGRSRSIPLVVEKPNTNDKDNDLKKMIEKMGLRKCVTCENWTDVSCKVCSTPFCHEECFDYVRKEHKESCGTGKELQLGETVGNRRKFPEPKMPPSGSKVKITAFQQTNVCYVRSTARQDDVAYFGVLTEVLIKGKAAVRLENLPKSGQMVLFKFETEIIRAMVLHVDNLKGIYVVCIDFGNIEVVKLEDLYQCSPYLADLPCYPIAVQLRGVPKGFMSPNASATLYQLSGMIEYKLKYSKQEYDSAKNMQIAVLIEVYKNGNLNRLLKTVISPTVPPLSDPGYKVDYLPHISLPTGKDIELVVMDNTLLNVGLIYCTLKELAYEVTKMQREMQAYGESANTCSVFAPLKDELCVAKYQGKWCRGLSMELVGDGYPSILFLDYGNIVPIHVSDIRPYPPQFIFPVLTTELDIIGFPENPTVEQVRYLEQYLIVGSTVTCSEIVRCQESNNLSVRFDELKHIFNLK
ncbi:hypothetical protein KR059_000284 [Drosophila kikkawai]|nr:hypothetical protein KR059_000284 [Drosophila kikkawai]